MKKVGNILSFDKIHKGKELDKAFHFPPLVAGSAPMNLGLLAQQEEESARADKATWRDREGWASEQEAEALLAASSGPCLVPDSD